MTKKALHTSPPEHPRTAEPRPAAERAESLRPASPAEPRKRYGVQVRRMLDAWLKANEPWIAEFALHDRPLTRVAECASRVLRHDVTAELVGRRLRAVKSAWNGRHVRLPELPFGGLVGWEWAGLASAVASMNPGNRAWRYTALATAVLLVQRGVTRASRDAVVECFRANGWPTNVDLAVISAQAQEHGR